MRVIARVKGRPRKDDVRCTAGGDLQRARPLSLIIVPHVMQKAVVETDDDGSSKKSEGQALHAGISTHQHVHHRQVRHVTADLSTKLWVVEPLHTPPMRVACIEGVVLIAW